MTILMLIIGCNGTTTTAQSIYDASKIDFTFTQNANAVVRLSEQLITLYDDKFVSKNTVVITALNKKGERFLNFHDFYIEETDRIKNLEIEILDEDGNRIRKIKNKEILDVAGVDGSLISSGRVNYYSHTANTFPISIIYSFEKESKNTCFLPTWYPINDYNIAIEKSIYKIENKSKAELRIKEKNLDRFGIPSAKEVDYTAVRIPAQKKQKYAPAFGEYAPSVFVSPSRFVYHGIEGTSDSWEDIGNWIYKNFLNSRNDLDKQKILAELNKIISTQDSQKEIVRKLYDYVQENTRYVSIQLAEGGYKPMNPSDVHDLKYGDCKALTFYMNNLLELYDIDSDYVLVNSGSNEKASLLHDLQSVNQFDHIITRIPLESDTIWLDCTSNDSPFNFLGSFTDDRTVLAINEEVTEVVNTPNYGIENNAQNCQGEIEISKDGDMLAKLNIKNSGIKAMRVFYLKKLGKNELDKVLKERRFSNLKQLDLQSSSFHLDEPELSFYEDYLLASKDLAETAGGYLLIPKNVIKFSIPKLPNNKNRILPIQFLRDEEWTSILTYKTPDGYTLVEEDLKEELLSEYGEYTSSVEQMGEDTIMHTRRFKLFEGTYPAEEYKKIKRYFDHLRKIEKSTINVKRNL